MASATLQISDRFVAGAPVDAFPAALVGEPRTRTPKQVPPVLSPSASGQVASDGTVTLDGLTAGTMYAATEGAARVLVAGSGTDWTVTVLATGGTYKLVVGGSNTASIAYNASAATVQTAVRATTAGASATVTATGNVYTITLAASSTITADGSSLTVTDPGAGRHWVMFGCATYAAPGRLPHPWVAPS